MRRHGSVRESGLTLDSAKDKENPEIMKKTLSTAIIMACVGLVWANPASAGPITAPTVGPGNSWVVTWKDGNYSSSFDKVEFFITDGTATFDAAATVSGTTGLLVNPLYTVVELAGGWSGNTVMTLSFIGNQADFSGVKVNVEDRQGTTLLNAAGFHWQWLGLPENQE